MLRVEDFRLPEEQAYRDLVAAHPALKRLKRLCRDYWDTEDAEEAEETLLESLQRDGVRLTKSRQPGLIEAVEEAFRMFGLTAPFEVYAVRDPEAVFENASVTDEDGVIVIQLLNDLLARMTPAELRGVIGHEMGHFLLGHTGTDDASICLAIAEDFDADELDEDVAAKLADDDSITELFAFAYVLSQLQELSSDRIGLLVSRDFEATVVSEVKLTAGFIGPDYDIQNYLDQAEAVDDDPSWIWRTHPTGPNRCRALKLFYESDLYRRAVGQPGGAPIADFSAVLPEIVPLIGDVDYESDAAPTPVDDYILELVLLETVGLADDRLTPKEEETIDRFIPAKYYDTVIAGYEKVIAELDRDPDRLDHYLERAAKKDAAWKRRMIERFVRVVRADRRITEEELDTVAEMAEAIGAEDECGRLFRAEFGYDPFS